MISVENRNIFPPRVFCPPPTEGVPLGIGYRRWEPKTRMMELPGQARSLMVSSAVWIQCTNVTDGQTDRRTDRQTPSDSKEPCLRTASRGKNFSNFSPSFCPVSLTRHCLFYFAKMEKNSLMYKMHKCYLKYY